MSPCTCTTVHCKTCMKTYEESSPRSGKAEWGSLLLLQVVAVSSSTSAQPVGRALLNHNIKMIWVERGLKAQPVSTSCLGQGHLPLNQAAWSLIQPGRTQVDEVNRETRPSEAKTGSRCQSHRLLERGVPFCSLIVPGNQM